MEKTYSLDEVANILKQEVTTVRKWCAHGKISAIKIGKRWIIKQDELNRVLKEGVK